MTALGASFPDARRELANYWAVRRRQRDLRLPDQGVIDRDARRFVRVGLGFLAVSLIPFGVFVFVLRDDIQLRDDPRVEARVIEVLHLRRSAKGPPETSRFRVEFTTTDGLVVSAVVRTTQRAVKPGDLIRISYDTSEPEGVRAVEGSELAWRVPLLIAGAIAFVGLCALWLAITI